MADEFRHNHYVPEWYQKRFIPPYKKHKELFYLDLHPEKFRDGRGVLRTKRPIRRIGSRHCFAQEDLYTTFLQGVASSQIEKQFFGKIDARGKRAVEAISTFSHPAGANFLNDLMLYMSTQKLRTPKGLDWLERTVRAKEKQHLLHAMVQLRDLFGYIWTESVWLIADASQSATKFILTDHPVTVYNRRCRPKSHWCRGNNDPDIRFNGTHTLFPLSLEKVLIITNLSWARNPYQSETALRPNPKPIRPALMKVTDIQTHRSLSEKEVREINLILKTRAYRYIGAGEEDWLCPEHHVDVDKWDRFGDGYLLMPDPRSMTFGGQIFFGNKGGGATAFDEYGRRPWEEDFNKNYSGPGNEWETFMHFQGEFARLIGPQRRGRSFTHFIMEPEVDDEDMHMLRLDQEQQFSKPERKAKRRRRRR